MKGPVSRSIPPPPPNVAVYVDILGTDLAVDFLLKFGGAELYHPDDPKGASELAKTFGIEAARKLAAVAPALKTRVPIPKKWIARVKSANGWPVAQIARTLHVTDVTVQKYLCEDLPRPRDPRQGSFF